MNWFIFIFDIFITNSSNPGFMDITKNITIHCDNRRLVRKLKNVSTPWWSLLRKSFPLLPSGFEPVTFDATVALVTVNCRLISPPPKDKDARDGGVRRLRSVNYSRSMNLILIGRSGTSTNSLVISTGFSWNSNTKRWTIWKLESRDICITYDLKQSVKIDRKV